MSIRQFARSWLVLAAFFQALVALGETHAQRRSPADSVYSRAHRLVAEGRGEAGRALVDSMIRATAPGSGDYAEALFWRASTSRRADDAERDYLRIVIEYPLSPRAEEALIRLAEMEMLRGDRTRAQRHLQRLVIEHPSGASRAKASYWLARIFFEANEMTRGCHELSIARSRVASTDIELVNQLDYQAQRCAGVTPGAVVATAPAPVARETTQSPKNVPGSPVTSRPAAESIVRSPPASAAPASAAPVTAPPATPVPSASPSPVRETPGPEERKTPARTFTVQVAAFPTREAAATFMESLKARGYDVRVWGGESPFRVRLGRFATREEASAMAAELRTKMISRDAWVTETEVR